MLTTKYLHHSINRNHILSNSDKDNL